MNVIPTAASCLIAANQQDCHPARVKGIQGPQRFATALRPKLTHMTMLGAVDATAMRKSQRRTTIFQQLHQGFYRRTLGLFELIPLLPEFVRIFDLPSHVKI